MPYDIALSLTHNFFAHLTYKATRGVLLLLCGLKRVWRGNDRLVDKVAEIVLNRIVAYHFYGNVTPPGLLVGWLLGVEGGDQIFCRIFFGIDRNKEWLFFEGCVPPSLFREMQNHALDFSARPLTRYMWVEIVARGNGL